MERVLDLSKTPFNLDYTLNSGQVFKWEKMDGWWYGVVNDSILKMKQMGNKLFFTIHPDRGIEFIYNYFRLDDNLPSILNSINKDPIINDAINRYYGLRLIRQDPWECLISFICATNNKIPNIQRMIKRLSEGYGNKLKFEGKVFYTFPKPQSLAYANLDKLKSYGLGYRAKFVINAAKLVASQELDLNKLIHLDYYTARENLLTKHMNRKLLLGVGLKVADCVLLFSLNKLNSFPIDVWILRVIINFYNHLFDKDFITHIKEKRLNDWIYNKIAERMRAYFGDFAGYAQEYLYYYIRHKSF
ncbi:MAG: DNA glycosylase [Nitrososphaerales archaeon]